MGLKHYLTDITTLKVGTAQADRAYVGSTLVWEALTASISPNPANGSATSVGGNPVNPSVAATCSATGGTVSSRAWSKVSGNTMTLSSTTAATVTFSMGSGTMEAHWTAVYQCVVTFVGGATKTATVTVNLDRYNDN